MVVVGLVPELDPFDVLPLPTDEHNCGLYAWHVELLANAALGPTRASKPRTPTKTEMRFMNPFVRR